MEAGFINVDDPTQLRLGISFVSNKLNLSEVKDIWHFCRKKNIFPNMEILTPTGRAKNKLASQKLTKEEITEYKLKILNIDREVYNYNWLPYTPLTASGCLQHLYSFYITLNGDVRPCAPTKFDQHPFFNINGKYPYNIYNMDLKEIIKSELFTYVRNIDKHLEGKCKTCEHLNECIGCRGYAYSIGINKGMNPLKALQMECQQCFKN
jgi:radical SAM protein with 4Fe4S-binding SPASM domain